jgi:GGDEF domain-containing protein
MTETELIDLLARTAAALTAAGTEADALERVVVEAGAQAGARVAVEPGGALDVSWDGDAPSAAQTAFANALGECLALARSAQRRDRAAILDPRGFASELDRAVASARWRGHGVSVAVFMVEGMRLDPGVDETALIEHVGAVARTCVRGDDVVGHLGASQFALLLPRSGGFEARIAFRRVRAALQSARFAGYGLDCRHVGFAELSDGADILSLARERLALARRRTLYASAPRDPTPPLAG